MKTRRHFPACSAGCEQSPSTYLEGEIERRQRYPEKIQLMSGQNNCTKHSIVALPVEPGESPCPLAIGSTVNSRSSFIRFTPTAQHVQAALCWAGAKIPGPGSGCEVDALQRFEGHGDVDDEVRLSVAFRLEAGVDVSGFAGWGMMCGALCPPSSEHSVLGNS